MRDRVRDIRPARSVGYEVRFETPPGEQAQVDFARFVVEFLDEPGITYLTWTAEGLLRHTVYVGLREDKLAASRIGSNRRRRECYRPPERRTMPRRVRS